MSKVVIVGSGPAGVSAALYTARAGVETTVLTKGPGTLERAERIENYYGFAEPVTGAELARRGIEGAKAVGVQFGVLHEDLIVIIDAVVALYVVAAFVIPAQAGVDAL